ncbi:MAG: NUDIX hydrolase [Candidatus Hodarchaeales archaeon]|jgi:8-oxo-dGTP pyrophosphatase MutT (NUDIX family)
MIKHFTATTYLIDPKFEHTLLLFHRKFNSWLPPGGHIHPNETPEEAARREIREEIGDVDIKFIPNGEEPHKFDKRTETLLLPHIMLSEEIEKSHYHLDMIFYAIIPKKDYISPENLNLKWFSLREIQNENKIFENVQKLAINGFHLRKQYY